MTTINNGIISISVKALGAELCSLKKAGETHEYMWTGNPEFWAGQSPVLFPIVGSVQNETTEINGQVYSFKNHGFARRQEFQLIKKLDNKLVFSLTENEETLKSYPFKFELRLSYTLIDSEVQIAYEVRNTDNQEIYFQLGTHPGFNCPMEDGLSLSDYHLEFSDLEDAKRYFVNDSNLNIAGKEQVVFNSANMLPLNHELFYEGALIFRDLKSKSVELKSNKGHRSLRMSWFNFPYMGIWQPKNAPFICIEPWHGLGDSDTHRTAFKNKEMIVTLQPDEVFHAAITIEV
jgi:galactose mutarotase-like enzyme